MLEIKHLPNLMLTPLVAWASTESLETLAEQLIGNMKAFVAGTPRNLVMYGVEVRRNGNHTQRMVIKQPNTK